MKRTLPWALVAFFPLASLFAVTALEHESSAQLSQLAANSSAVAFLLRYWWAILFAAIVAQIVWFLAAVLSNRALPSWARIAWSIAMALFGPIAAPAYWWLHSARGK